MKTWIASGTLLVCLLTVGESLASWEVSSLGAADGAPPPAESVKAVSAAASQAREYRDSTTAIGTVLALRSVKLRSRTSSACTSRNCQTR